MSRKNDFQKIGYPELSPHFFIAMGILLILLVYYTDTFPYRSDWYLSVSIPTGVFCFLKSVKLYKKPNLYAKFFFHASLSVLFALVASRCLSSLFPQFSFIIHAIIIIAVLYAHALHIWDAPTANFVRNELWAPRTWWAKLFSKVMLMLASIGFPLALTLSHYGRSIVSVLFLGVLCLIVSIGFAFSRAPSSPWEASPPTIDQQDNKNQEIKEKTPLSLKKTSGLISPKKRIKK